MQTAVKQQRCFVCDNIVTDKCISLLSSKTPLTKVWLPNKIGSIVGDGYAVYVNYDDGLCLSCWNIFKQLDSYENNVEVLKTTILQHLRKKYNDEFQKENMKKISGSAAGGGVRQKTSQSVAMAAEAAAAALHLSNSSIAENDTQTHWLNNNNNKNDNETKKGTKSGPTFRCSECSFKDGDLNVLRKHITVCEKMTNCKYCNVRISLKNLAKHYSAMHSLFVCKVCNYRASDRNALLAHMKVNHAMNQYEGRTIARTGSTNVVSSATTATGQLACTACDFVTDSNEALNAHKHTHGKIFKCNKCSQHYDNFEAIKEHAKIHKKVTIYKCGICSATYKDRNQFMQHIVVHVDRKTTAATSSAATNASSPTVSAATATTTGTTTTETYQQQQDAAAAATLMISETGGDLESLLEKISAGTTVNMVPVVSTPSSSTVVTATSVASDIQATAATTIVKTDDDGSVDDQQQQQQQQVRIAYKCQMCNEVFGTSNEYQLHVITACHGQVELNIDDENSDIKLVTNDNGRKQLLMPNGDLLDITDAEGVFETGDVVMATTTTTSTTTDTGANEATAVADDQHHQAVDLISQEQVSVEEQQTGESMMNEDVENAAAAAAAGHEEPQGPVLDMVSIADEPELETTGTIGNESMPPPAVDEQTNGTTVAESVNSETTGAAVVDDCPMDIDEIEEPFDTSATAADVTNEDVEPPVDENIKSKSKSVSKSSNKKN